MKINQRQFEAVLALPGPRRYGHFIKVVADRQLAWLLYRDGWALAATGAGETVFPLWPAREYAAACAAGDWSGYEPRPFSLEELQDELLPRLRDDGVLPGVFPTPGSQGVTPSVAQLLADLDLELRNYA